MKRKIASLVLGFAVLSILGASDMITETEVTTDVRGPGKTGAEGKGAYGVGKGNDFVSVRFYAKDTETTQLSQIGANVDMGKKTWSGTLGLVPGNYDCYAKLATYTKEQKQLNITPSKPKNVTVKAQGK